MYLCDAGPSEGNNHSHHIDSQLKLQKLRDAVIDITPPHHSFDDTGEVVIGKDDVRGLLCNICPCNSL